MKGKTLCKLRNNNHVLASYKSMFCPNSPKSDVSIQTDFFFVKTG